MRVMADANIIVSAILFPKSTIANVLKHLIDNYSLVLSKYTICEIEDVFNEKFSHKIAEMKEFLLPPTWRHNFKHTQIKRSLLTNHTFFLSVSSVRARYRGHGCEILYQSRGNCPTARAVTKPGLTGYRGRMPVPAPVPLL